MCIGISIGTHLTFNYFRGIASWPTKMRCPHTPDILMDTSTLSKFKWLTQTTPLTHCWHSTVIMCFIKWLDSAAGAFPRPCANSLSEFTKDNLPAVRSTVSGQVPRQAQPSFLYFSVFTCLFFMKNFACEGTGPLSLSLSGYSLRGVPANLFSLLLRPAFHRVCVCVCVCVRACLLACGARARVRVCRCV